MKLMRSIRVMVVLTGLALIYVYMQMEIIGLAYEGKRKERQIIELTESTGVLSYKIHQLKSSNHLGNNLLNEQSSLRFQDNRSVVELVTREPIGLPTQAAAVSTQKANPLLNFLFKPPAEARAEEQRDSLKPWRRSR